MFSITDNKGFHITFANGWTVSVQFGRGNYCDNRDGDKESSQTAEVAAWDERGAWHHFDDDTVAGWQTPEQVAKFISQIAAK